MSAPSDQNPRLVAVKKEVCTMNQEIPSARPFSSSEAAEAKVDEITVVNMSAPSYQNPGLFAVKKEVCTMNQEIPRARPFSSSEAEEDEITAVHMLAPSYQNPGLVAVEKEVCTMNQETPHHRPFSSSEAAEAEEDGIPYLSGNPYFDVILAKSHLSPVYQLSVPSKMHHLLPRATVPVVLRHGGKNWDVYYIGDARQPRFDNLWRTFATDNHLKVGDACVFELMEKSSTKLRFKVHILRCDLPLELLALIESRGTTPGEPIVID